MQDEIGRRMFVAISDMVGFTTWHLMRQPPDDRCLACGRRYKRPKWLMRHYRRTRHWKEVPDELG